MERMSEKYWGEILERTLSSTSLQALQQSFSGQGRTPLAHHSNRFNHSSSMLTNQTSVLSLNHISRDNGLDLPYRMGSNSHLHHYTNNHRHSYLDTGNARSVENKNHINTESDDDDDEGEEGEEEEEENGDIEEEEEETSNSDSVQDNRGHGGGGGGCSGPRVSFLSHSETRLNDYSIHDKNCAKAKALNAQIQSVKGLPGI